MLNESEGVINRLAAISHRAPGLAGVSGAVRIEVGREVAGTVIVDDARVSLSKDDEAAETVVRFERAEDLTSVLCGELNPFVAWVQQRMEIRGDLVLAVKVLVGIQVSGRSRAPANQVMDIGGRGDEITEIRRSVEGGTGLDGSDIRSARVTGRPPFGVG